MEPPCWGLWLSEAWECLFLHSAVNRFVNGPLFATAEVLFAEEEERPPGRSALVHGICHAVMEYDFQFYTKETDLATFQGVELSSVQLSRSELGPWNRITYRRAIGSAGWWIDIKVH